MLVSSHHPHKIDHILAKGAYRFYEIKDEQNLHNNPHLELSVGKDEWQGYLLLTGFPKDTKKRSRIIPTTEVITKTNS